jgi:hypothetical protein
MCTGSPGRSTRRAPRRSGWARAAAFVGRDRELARIELLRCLREQTVSRTRHRFGNLVAPELFEVDDEGNAHELHKGVSLR